LTKKDLEKYLSEKCFKGFKVSSKKDDFFSVFSALFKKLDQEEEMEEDVKTTHHSAAAFGDIDSTKEEVMAFYDEWKGFSTLKQFAYVD
jgi:hypothetical protein